MTQERMAEIKAMCDAATPGKWRVVDKGNTVPSHAIVMYSTGHDPVNVASAISPKTGNAAFIAAARLVVPELLAEVERQAAEIEQLGRELAAKNAALELAAYQIQTLRQRDPQTRSFTWWR